MEGKTEQSPESSDDAVFGGEGASDAWGRRNTAGVVIASSIRFENVIHRYGERVTLGGVSLVVEPGEVVCLLGPSGSGKTTLLRITAGLGRPESGRVVIDNRVVTGENVFVAPEHRGVGLVFQDFALFPHMTNIANVEFGLTALDRIDRRPQAMRILDRVGLAHAAELYPHQLSGGEQQRIALARALAPRPGILLMDEPFSGLDARLRENVRTETLRLLRDTRSTVLIVTHDPEEAMEIADRIVLMRDGKIVQQGTAREIYDHPNSLFSVRFFSEVNQFAGVVADGKVATPLGSLEARDPSGNVLPEGMAANVCIRRSDIRFADPPRPTRKARADISQPVPARILSRRFIGEAELAEIAIANWDDTIQVRLRQGELAPQARDVAIRVDSEKAFIFPVAAGKRKPA